MLKKDVRPFFVGYGKKIPSEIAKLVFPAFALFISVMVFLSIILSSSQGDPGEGRFRWDQGRQTFNGVLEFRPYPVLRLPADGDQPPMTLMVSGNGKRGAFGNAKGLAGEAVTAWGIVLERGDIPMLQVAGRKPMGASDDVLPAGFEPAEPVKLGKWRLAGEICDGKCYLGAMRPGQGLAHKACTNLCIIGGTPAVFVSSGAVGGSDFFLLADENGNPLGEELFDYVALLIEVEGEVERLDNLNVFKMDLSTIEVLP